MRIHSLPWRSFSAPHTACERLQLLDRAVACSVLLAAISHTASVAGCQSAPTLSVGSWTRPLQHHNVLKLSLKLLREQLTYPALFSGTGICFDDVWRVDAYVQAQH